MSPHYVFVAFYVAGIWAGMFWGSYIVSGFCAVLCILHVVALGFDTPEQHTRVGVRKIGKVWQATKYTFDGALVTANSAESAEKAREICERSVAVYNRGA